MYDEQQPDGEPRSCVDCARTWFYSERERAFMESKGFAVPKRCPECRRRRRREGWSDVQPAAHARA
jgi:hypothetical protein